MTFIILLTAVIYFAFIVVQYVISFALIVFMLFLAVKLFRHR